MSATAKLSAHLRRRVGALQRKLDRVTASPAFATTPRAIHDARVTVRRLRELLRAQHDGFDVGAAKRYRRLLKRLTRDLEPVREADVVRRELAALVGGGADVHAAFARSLQDHAELEYERAVHRLQSRMATMSWGQVLADLRDLSTSAVLVIENAEPAAAAMNRVVRRRRQRLRAAMRRAGTAPNDLHRIRLKVKTVRYLLEDCLSNSAAETNLELKRLRRLQDCLGELHDQENLMNAISKRYEHRKMVRRVCRRLEARKCRYVHSFKRQRRGLMRLWDEAV